MFALYCVIVWVDRTSTSVTVYCRWVRHMIKVWHSAQLFEFFKTDHLVLFSLNSMGHITEIYFLQILEWWSLTNSNVFRLAVSLFVWRTMLLVSSHSIVSKTGLGRGTFQSTPPDQITPFLTRLRNPNLFVLISSDPVISSVCANKFAWSSRSFSVGQRADLSELDENEGNWGPISNIAVISSHWGFVVHAFLRLFQVLIY